MKEVSLKELLEAGCHFGHQTTRWNPKMKPYIFTSRDNIHIFDLVKTKEGLENAGKFIKESLADGKQILFVGTKRQAQDIIKAAAEKAVVPYMTRRWIGGLLTNWSMVKKRLDHLKELKTGKVEGRFKKMTKKENLMIDREIGKMEMDFGGVVGLDKVPEIVFVVDARKDFSAVKEAKGSGATVIAIVDTNSNPDLVDYVIPANDDATRSIQLIVDYLVEAVEEGRKDWGVKKEKEAERLKTWDKDSKAQPAKVEKKEVGSEKIEAGKEVGSAKLENKEAKESKKEVKIKTEKPKKVTKPKKEVKKEAK